jgi:NAD(P)-dependent dehydrogenase (short-subunit alcohol dehydrogenase family)
VGLARYGARVALAALEKDELDMTAHAIDLAGGDCLVLPVDLCAPEQVKRAVERTEEAFGPIDILVNNAAVLRKMPFEEMTPSIWREHIDVNLHGAYYCTREVYPEMVHRGDGAIINVSSSAGYRGSFWGTAYCAGKFGLEGFAQALGQEARRNGILVTLAVPGVALKPTSVNEASYRAMPEDERRQYADPLVIGDAFCFLATCRDMRLTGRRFDLYALSGRVRARGLNLDCDEVVANCVGPYEPGREML